MRVKIEEEDFNWFEDDKSFIFERDYLKEFPELFISDGYDDLEKRLSKGAFVMITRIEREKTILNSDGIKILLESNGIPAFEKIIDFQQQYGGRSYKVKYGTPYVDDGYSIDLIDFNQENMEAKLNGHLINKNLHFFNCMGEHFSAGHGLFIGNNGCIYEYNFNGSMVYIAESMEKFIEQEWGKVVEYNKR
jgi:hypothetical protein